MEVEEDQSERDKAWMSEYSLTEGQLGEVKECFEMFEVDGGITTAQLGLALRVLGQNPTEAEIQELATNAELSENGTIPLAEYVRVVGTRGLKSDSQMEDELEDALRVFDKEDDGFLVAQDLREMMRTLGDAVDNDDVMEFMKVADVDSDGRMYYMDLVKKLTTSQ